MERGSASPESPIFFFRFKEGCAAAPGSEMSGGEENKRSPPKPLTFGEFLTPHRTQRKRKGRGRGQGTGTKPYRSVGSCPNEDLVGWGSSPSLLFPRFLISELLRSFSFQHA